LMTGDYLTVLQLARRGDTVYLDPPYVDTSGKELFARYTHSVFGRREHALLCEVVGKLSQDGVSVLMTVRDDPWIRELYEDLKTDVIDTRNVVGARGAHGRVSDLLIRNFD
jgi:DNA adenine methylase